VGGVREEEVISPQPVMIRYAREIVGEVYACGSERQVFRRTGEKQWRDISAPRAEQAEAIGFEGMDGYGPNEIYASC